MSARHIDLVWRASGARPTSRLVLLALADSANRDGIAAISQRTLAEMVGLSKSRVVEALDALQKAQEIDLRSEGNGRAPAIYQLTLGKMDRPAERDANVARDAQDEALPSPVVTVAEAPQEKPKTVSTAPSVAEDPLKQHGPPPAEYPQNIVGLIMHAAGITINPRQRFYWHVQEHRAEAQKLINEAGDLNTALVRLRQAQTPPDVKRLTALIPYVKEEPL